MASLAGARVALEEAEKRAKAEAEAEAARQRAEAEKRQAEDEAFHADLDRLAGPWEPVDAARQALTDARVRLQSAQDAASKAQQAVVAARDALPALVERAVAGEPVSAEDVAAAHVDVNKAEQFAAFLGIVASRCAPAVQSAQAAVQAALTAAHRPVYEEGLRLRVKAGRAADAAFRRGLERRIPGRTDPDPQEMAEAKAIFDHANRLLRAAEEHGLKIPVQGGIPTKWPTSEHIERAWCGGPIWGKR
ncbi:hypothetical protein [Roseicella aerolata]|uniref:Uncharacterized protein n=1 Tax=Roseicella aerolata TaxID=2883479 RepID=A0A9X1IIZ0_9PROT|nr:hypothetical protein [Roseicella aerolata]MCB4825492.1 hypothetical protein [Roseicella aerolata]